MGEQGPTFPSDATEPQKPDERSVPKAREGLIDRARLEAGVRGVLKKLPPSYDVKATLVSRFRESMGDVMPELGELLAEELRRQIASVPADDIDALVDRVDYVVNVVASQHITRADMEARQREYFFSFHDFMPLSETLAFGVSRGTAHIHLAPSSALGIAALRADVEAGLRELARRMQEDDELKGVTSVQGTSWIVARHPRLLERLGFTIDGPISEDEHAAHFAEESRPVASAHMDRADFLARYGKDV